MTPAQRGGSGRARGVTILLAAAGGSSRMRGADKLLEPVDGEPLLRRQARAAVATGCPVLVALPPAARARRAALAGLPVIPVEVARASEGMGRSLRAGAAAAGRPRGLLVMLADMPEIATGDLQALLDAFDARWGNALVRAIGQDGTPGHPVIFPGDTLDGFAALAGDHGARAILAAHRARILGVALPGRRALIDLDTPEDWADWRAAR